MEINELFGTLQQSTIKSWRYHLKTNKKSIHDILDDFYKEIPELVDTLIENYQGIYGIVDNYLNILDDDDLDNISYFEELRDIVSDGYGLFDDSELISDLDDIQSLIDSTLYKLKNLTESKLDLSSYLKECLE